MRTAGFCAPLIVTCATPLICESCWARIVSAESSTTVSGNEVEVSARSSIGESAGLTFR